MTKEKEEKTKLIFPFVGEFGYELMFMVGQVNGIEGKKIVFHGKDKESLYPSADELIEWDLISEVYNFKSHRLDARNYELLTQSMVKSFGDEYEILFPDQIRRMEIKPFKPVPKQSYLFETDVCIFPRNKTHQAWKNYEHWDELIEELGALGIKVFAAGRKDDSFSLPCESAWDYDNPNDASLHAIYNSKIRLGKVTALHHLAMICDKSSWIFCTVPHMASEKNLLQTKWWDAGWINVFYQDDLPMLLNIITNYLKENHHV